MGFDRTLVLIAALAIAATTLAARGADDPAKSGACPAAAAGAASTPDVELDTTPNPDRLRCEADEQLRQGDEQLRQYLEMDEENRRLIDAQTAYGKARDLYQQAGDRSGQAKALLGLARTQDYLDQDQ